MKQIYLKAKNLFFSAAAACVLFQGYSQCTFGNFGANFDVPTSYGANYLLGTRHYTSSAVTVTHLGMFGNNTGSGVIMALYSDNNGVPANLLGYTTAQTVGAGNLDFPITPVEVAEGYYWIMAVFNNAQGLNNHTLMNTGLGNTVHYMDFNFASGTLPNPYTGTENYDGQDFLYYAKTSELQTVEVNSCGPYTWVDGNTYTESNNTAQHFVAGGGTGGCDLTMTLDLTVYPELDLSVNVVGTMLSANLSGAGYQWVDCNDGNALIAGATNQSYAPMSSGSYAVLISSGECEDYSECFDVVVSGVGLESNTEQFVALYPNPVSDVLFLELKDISRIQILSVSGQVLLDFDAAQTHQLDLSNLSQGVYFVRVNNEALRFVKQ